MDVISNDFEGEKESKSIYINLYASEAFLEEG